MENDAGAPLSPREVAILRSAYLGTAAACAVLLLALALGRLTWVTVYPAMLASFAPTLSACLSAYKQPGAGD